MKRLIIRADDAGSSLSANRAIFDCATRGLARNVSLMACGPFIEDASQVLAGLADVDFGLHVTLSSEWDAPRWGSVASPNSVPRLLDEDGCFSRAPSALFERGVDEAMLDQIEFEAQHQLARLRDLGFEVKYLDEHMGVGWLPGARERLELLARRESLLLASQVPGLPEAQGLASASQVLGRRVTAAPQGDRVFVTHPAFDDAEMQGVGNADYAPGQIARERDADRALLLDAGLRAELERQQVRVARYSQILGSTSVRPEARKGAA